MVPSGMARRTTRKALSMFSISALVLAVSTAPDLRVTVEGPIALDAGDWFRVDAFQNSGGSLNIKNTDDSTAAAGGRAASYLTIVPLGAFAVT